MADRLPITAEYVRSRLDYDPESGIFTWRARPIRPHLSRMDKQWNTRFTGKRAGTPITHGYVQILIDCHPHRAHRLAWLWVHGSLPDCDIDHKDRDPSNNRIANLRLATNPQNQANASLRKDNISGHRGVGLERTTGKWRARIRVNGARRALGLFKTKEEAAAAYQKAAREAFGEFAGE